ncbi:C45 family autoproteolytic acyltransferase/hydolase [Sediminibacillus massiliensis]|uniref:C45 family autoproteolytic acyltransferase/hydolase n=1 Tax=Sediminibacillus massiliensis TaxID=1926277 RepID=UPI0009883534|nr:C45 family peptidase [Sediminibacillus massiliensis]
MKQIASRFLEFRGTHYEFGYRQGQELKGTILYENHLKWNKPRRRPRYIVNQLEAKQLIRSLSPLIWEELEGIADGLKVPIEQVVKNYSGYQQEWIKSGCSILTGKDYYVRNYDYHPKTYEGRFVIFQPKRAYATIGPTQRITGRTDGMNEEGLVIGYNFVNRRNPGDGFICNMISRMILENCKTNEEAIELIKEIPHRHSFNYVLYDKGGNSHVVEGTPRAVEIREGPISTNHFDILRHENRHHLGDSFRRKKLLEENISKLSSCYEAFRFFNDRDRGIFSEKYTNWAGTLHTTAYIPKDLSVWYAVGGDREPFIFSFKEWLKGKDSRIKKLRGYLNTEEAMPFMDRS